MYMVSRHLTAVLNKPLLRFDTCRTQVNSNSIDVNHWRCPKTASGHQSLLAWRMLKHLSGEGWAPDLLDMLYLEKDVIAWAEAGISDEGLKHRLAF
ncbi:hypothetical protein [Pontibacterium sinense]|uniref:hypothetical protein n=1 Tax=Pontibacterium sinense TaxID=2781979 RepID=UPI001D1424A2|nr:hypothetical protein [Pontibacterium sinense]